MTKVWFKPRWFRDVSRDCLTFVRGGLWEEGSEIKDEDCIRIPTEAYLYLREWMIENDVGVVKTDRTEDLKIIHRLIDLLEVKKDA